MAAPRIDRRERMAEQTRRDILVAARRLFPEQGYAATSVGDVAREAGVAVQTIYARLGSKRGMLMALVDLIAEEAGLVEATAQVQAATTARDVLYAGVRLTRQFQERCGDVIGALFGVASLEPELADAVAEARMRHRLGVRMSAERMAALGGLRAGVSAADAAALISVATSHEAWMELVRELEMSWDEAEQTLATGLDRAILKPRRGR